MKKYLVISSFFLRGSPIEAGSIVELEATDAAYLRGLGRVSPAQDQDASPSPVLEKTEAKPDIKIPESRKRARS
jgi:hypothetical protein